MKLKFIIDREYDESILKDPECAKVFGFKKETLKKMEMIYKTSLPYLELTRKLYQKSWDEINDKFSEYVEKETGYKWFYPKYECVVSVRHEGISNWGEAPKIVRWWRENPYYMRTITAHELILSHYFEIYKRYYSKEGLKDGQVWALAEIAAYALLSLTPESKKFWPWDAIYYTNHDYPHIVEIQNKLKTAFLKRKSFDDYIRKGIFLVKEYPNMNPKGK
jgi:hypothetical protein